MTPEAEKKVLSSLYDRLFDAVTYVPGDGKQGAIDKSTSYFQMPQNYVLNPADFKNALSPINPNGDVRAGKAFSDLVDALPVVGPSWAPSGNKVSAVFKNVVTQADATTVEDPEQRKRYDKAYAFLNQVVSIPNVEGPPTDSAAPSPIAQTYNDNQTAYMAAITGYRTAYNGYDLTKVADQRSWQANEPMLANTLNQAWNKWIREGKANVDQAQQLLQTTINDAVRHAIAQAQAAMQDAALMAPLVAGDDRWPLSYAMPSNWWDESAKSAQLTLKSSYLNTTASSEATSYSAGGSGMYGLWSFGGDVSGSSAEQHAHMDAEDFDLSADLVLVRINRPWMNTALFNMTNWYVEGLKANGISAGVIDAAASDLMMPLLPTAFVIAKNVKISAGFSSEDKSHIEKSISTKAKLGWGPFGVNVGYQHSSSKDTATAKFDGGTLTLPGLQLIGWVSAITPASPPEAAPAPKPAEPATAD